MSSTPVQAHRASVNGLDTYYEVQGSGKPLVMLHGAILVDLGPSVAALARDHTVITPHLQGRGHTRDIDRPFSYEAMAFLLQSAFTAGSVAWVARAASAMPTTR